MITVIRVTVFTLGIRTILLRRRVDFQSRSLGPGNYTQFSAENRVDEKQGFQDKTPQSHNVCRRVTGRSTIRHDTSHGWWEQCGTWYLSVILSTFESRWQLKHQSGIKASLVFVVVYTLAHDSWLWFFSPFIIYFCLMSLFSWYLLFALSSSSSTWLDLTPFCLVPDISITVQYLFNVCRDVTATTSITAGTSFRTQTQTAVSERSHQTPNTCLDLIEVTWNKQLYHRGRSVCR